MPADPARRPLRADDVLRLRWIEDPRPSPDGHHVAFVERRVDEALGEVRSRVLVVRVADGAIGCPSPDDALDAAPRWSPDGSRLVFLAVRGAAVTPMSCAPDGTAAAPVDWFPEGVVAALPLPGGGSLFTIRIEEAGDPALPLWEVPAPGWRRDGRPDGERTLRGSLIVREGDGSTRTLTERSGDRAATPSPDARTVAVVSEVPDGPGGAAVGIRLIPAGGGPARLLVPDAARVTALAWSPDGTEIAWLGRRDTGLAAVADRLHRTSLATGETRELALAGVSSPGAAIRSDDPRGMGDARMEWTGDGRIWLRWVADGAGRLGWVAATTRRDTTTPAAPVVVVAGDRAPLAFGLTPDGALLAHVTADLETPGALAIVRVADGTELARVDRNEWLGAITLGPTIRIRAFAPDGVASEARLTLPPPTRAMPTGGWPLVVSVHGGPHYAVGDRFAFETHRLAARGYAVLAGNPRGSGGYGDDFATAIVGDWGGPDLADTLALLDVAAARPDIDGSRVAITGVSYGGWMTLWAIARSGRFRAAIAENPIADLVSAFGAGEDDGSFWAGSLGGAPWEVPDRYLDRSPITHADAIRTPLLLLHAELDRNCPPSQSSELFTALRRLGRRVRYLRARDVGHLMNFTGGTAFRAARAAAIDDWLDRYLLPPAG